MTNEEIKVLFSEKVLNLRDKAAETVLRKVLFGTEQNKIDWQEAYKVALTEMPELKKEKESSIYDGAYIGICPNCGSEVMSGLQETECYNCGKRIILNKKI